ncbi:MAG TPA: tRNA lysidine(34) synthetase TilS [Candidatus Babeliales bacterium]|nr:tRNA lysidine(34) synthetase TilS [Candidatus Babeliales bacterium]
MKDTDTNLLKNIHAFIAKHNLIPPHAKIVLGLSGGPDSLFLLHLLAPLHHAGTITLVAAHLDHGWREASARDAQFCLKVGSDLGVPVISRKLSDLAFSCKFNGSQEEIGRKARRYFLETVQQEHGADLIALAHHADDQQETFFIRMIRGASLAGLSAMQPKQGAYIRPLLDCKKQDLLDYLHGNNITYLIDATNEMPTYLRNRIRLNVLPALRNADPRFDTTFATTLNQIQDTQRYLATHTTQVFKEIADLTTSPIQINKTQFLALDPFMQKNIIMHWLCVEQASCTPTQRLFDEIIRFIQQPSPGIHALHTTWSLHKNKNVVYIKKNH